MPRSIEAPCCERCWIDREGEWEELESTPGHPVKTRLVKIRFPVRRVARETLIEVCHFCGEQTIFGVYVRTEVPR